MPSFQESANRLFSNCSFWVNCQIVGNLRGLIECQGLFLKSLGLGVRSKHSGFVWSAQVRVPSSQELGVKASVVSPLFFDPYHSVKVAEVQYYITSGSLLWLAR